jgi:two-component system response regulator ChvI
MAYLVIVDDDEDFATAAATVLRGDGHEVRIELEIPAAAKGMEERRPDLVILDVMFPESSSAGFDFARTMRHDRAKLKDIPVLMLTAVNVKFPLGFNSRDLDDVWLPVDDFLEKPVDLDMLRNKVSSLLHKMGSAGGPERAAPRTE